MSPKARAAAETAMATLARYPDDFVLKQALAERSGIGMERIVLGNGSNDVLDLIARVFLGARTLGDLRPVRFRRLSAGDAVHRR